MADNPFLKFDTLSLHAGQQPDPATGARAVAAPPDDLLTSSRHRPCGGAVQHGAPRPRLQPHLQPDQRGARRTRRGAGRRRRRHRTASGQAALHLAIATLMGAGSHIVASKALYGGSPQPAHYTLPRFGIDDHLRRSARPGRLGAPRSGPKRGCCSARRSATRVSTCWTSRPWRSRARGRPAAAGRLHLHHAVPDAARSTTAPTSSIHSATKFLSGTAS